MEPVWQKVGNSPTEHRFLLPVGCVSVRKAGCFAAGMMLNFWRGNNKRINK